MNSLRNALYSITTAACFLTVTMVPCAWSLVQLASRYLAAQHGQLKLDGVLFLLTVLSLEVFMRFWLLAVMQLLLQRVVRPGLLWLLLRMAGPQASAAGALGNAGASGQQQQQQQLQQGSGSGVVAGVSAAGLRQRAAAAATAAAAGI
jgi:hypothetical protein